MTTKVQHYHQGLVYKIPSLYPVDPDDKCALQHNKIEPLDIPMMVGYKWVDVPGAVLSQSREEKHHYG